MTQKLIDLAFSEEQLRAIDGAIAVLEANLTGLIALSAAQRLGLQKMGSAGEPFCRNTVSALAQNPQIVPPSLGLTGAQADMRALDQLRPRGMRLKVLAGRVADSEMALGSDVFAVARVGYKLIGAIGGGQGLKGARRELEPRYYRPKRGGRREPGGISLAAVDCRPAPSPTGALDGFRPASATPFRSIANL